MGVFSSRALYFTAEKERTEDEKTELEEAFKQQQSEMQEHFGALQTEKEEQKQLEDKLAAMQAKVMKGGTNLLDQEVRVSLSPFPCVGA